MLRHLRRHHLRTVHPYRVEQMGTAHPPQRRRRGEPRLRRHPATRRRLHVERRPAAGGDRPGVQRRSAGRRAGRCRCRGWPGGGRRIPTDLRAWGFRARRCVVAISAQARRQPRGPRRAAQSAVRLGRHRVDGCHRPPVRTVGGVHRSPAGNRRVDRKSSCCTRDSIFRSRSRTTATSPTAGRWRTPPESSSSSPSAAADACWARTSWATRRRRSSSR